MALTMALTVCKWWYNLNVIAQPSQQVIFIKGIGADLELARLMQAYFMKHKSMGKTSVLKVGVGFKLNFTCMFRFRKSDNQVKKFLVNWCPLNTDLTVQGLKITDIFTSPVLSPLIFFPNLCNFHGGPLAPYIHTYGSG